MKSERSFVQSFVPFVHVKDVARSTEFYERFGFKVEDTYDVGEERVWCWLERDQARLMLAKADAPVVASEQAVLFYLYAHNMDELRAELAQVGLEPTEVKPGGPGPDREFRVFDPDGYCVIVTETVA